jgi:receptor protein-tyrosine kinase
MSAEPRSSRSFEKSDQEIAEALELLFKLPKEAIESIYTSMKTLHVRFSEAALHTGLVTPTELKEAQELAGRQRGNERHRLGIVEEMLRRQSRRREVALWTGTPLVPGRDLVLAHDPDSPRSEALRSLRTELLIRTKGRPRSGVVALSSPSSGEGRSQLAAELAIAFAQLGRRTLLIDADLRRPRQHELFGAENTTGLSQVLAQGAEPWLHGIENLPHLALLTSGGSPRNPVELLSGRRFEQMLADWARNFEFILLDTSPAADFSDALAVATVARNVIVIGREKKTSFSALTRLCRNLHTTRANILGAVINSF